MQKHLNREITAQQLQRILDSEDEPNRKFRLFKIYLLLLLWICAITNVAFSYTLFADTNRKVSVMQTKLFKARVDLYDSNENYKVAIETFDRTFDKSFE